MSALRFSLTCSVAVAIAASACTLMVVEASGTRSATFADGGWSKFELRAAEMTSGLRVRGGSASTLTAKAELGALLSEGSETEAFDNAQIVFRRVASVLSLSMAADGDFAELIYFKGLEIDTPSTVDLDIEANDTNIEITGMSGAVRAKTGAGRVDVTTGGAIDIEAGSGTIKASCGTTARIRGGSGTTTLIAGSKIDVDSDGGTVQADTPVGGIVKSDSGIIDLKLTANTFGITTVESNSGNVVVRVPKGSQYNLDAWSKSGIITIDVGGLTVTDPYNGPVNGGGPLVTIRTDTGSLTVTDQ